MDFFYVDPEDVHGTTLVIRRDEFKHLTHVMRKKIGDRIHVTDGNDQMYDVVILSTDHRAAECEILKVETRVNEPRLDVALGISLLKNPGRMDFLFEKATELGARTIIPMICTRTIPKHEKHSRLEKIALASMKQCA